MPIEREVRTMERIIMENQDLRSEHRIRCNGVSSSRTTFEGQEGLNNG
jgi:hypothetical protein